MAYPIEKEFETAMRWFSSIASAVGKEKQSVIRSCRKQDDDGWNLLVAYLNPYHVFHVGVKSLASDVSPDGEPYPSANALLSDLMQVPSLNHVVLAKVKQTLATIENDDVRQFAADYITKQLKIGVTAATVNKAAGEQVVPVFGCMLANKYFEHLSAVIGKTIAVTEKLDGIRALAFVQVSPERSCVEIFSRQGQLISGLTEVENAILYAIHSLKLPHATFVFDGELLVTNRQNIPSKEQYKQTIKIVREDSNENKTGITYNVFDIVPLKDFLAGQSEIVYAQRRRTLERLSSGFISPALRLVPIELTCSYANETEAYNAIVALVERARKEGKEGVMLNLCDAPYVCKRTNNLLKVKVFQDCDLKIIGYQEGTGKLANTLGALIVDYKGNPVGVGSGLSDAQRKEFWENRKNYLGRVVTVQYFEETNDANGTKSIRFPVFKELREEGKEVSYE